MPKRERPNWPSFIERSFERRFVKPLSRLLHCPQEGGRLSPGEGWLPHDPVHHGGAVRGVLLLRHPRQAAVIPRTDGNLDA